MSKLPKSLEQMIEMKAMKYACISAGSTVETRAYKAGGTEIALEVKQMADKLVEALEKLERIKIDGVTYESQVVVQALTEWEAMWKEEK